MLVIKWMNEWLWSTGRITVKGKRGTWWNTCLNAILFVANITLTLLGLNLGLWGERLAASHLKQGRACSKCCVLTRGRYIATTQEECAKHRGPWVHCNKLFFTLTEHIPLFVWIRVYGQELNFVKICSCIDSSLYLYKNFVVWSRFEEIKINEWGTKNNT
jgi:hypothetical protein